jgi:dienelactone hydrolase
MSFLAPGWGSRRAVLAGLLTLAAVLLLASRAAAFDPAVEAQNFSKIDERELNITGTPEFQARLAQQNIDGAAELAEIQATDPERQPANICASRQNECAGDVRFYDWQKDGYGLTHPVLFTARDGATLSGTLWRTKKGPKERPGIVITTGSVQAPETLYWGLAATLAKHGFVVLTYDVQGQGRSDTLGEDPDAQEGVPSQQGQPFYDGTEDALRFLLSSQGHPYEPPKSCGNTNSGTGTSHAAKQDRRVEAGLNTAYNPYGDIVDHSRIGIAGHSLGAAAVSYIGQEADKVDAIVAWDNLSAPDSPGAECPARPGTRRDDVPITKPALGMSADYFLTPTPYTSDPDPQSKNQGFLAYKKAGVDSMQVNIRGGTHYEFSFLPGNTAAYPFGTATYRGMDMVSWYTNAWLERYVKCQNAECKRAAEDRLLTNQWRDDKPEGKVDNSGDSNMYSFYFPSRYDFGGKTCNDMRKGCASMVAGSEKPYWQIKDAQRPDSKSR